MNRQSVGKRGEDIAAEYIKKAGMAVLDRNFHCRQGEIDIVARDGETIAFIEVKTRSGKGYGTPAEAVTAMKQRKIIKAAYYYVDRKQLDGYNFRFDVVEVYIGGDGVQVNHIKNAFEV